MKCPLAAFVATLLFSFSPVLQARFAQPQLAPVNRLLKTAKAYVDAHPSDATGHYTLARIHYLAFARGAQNIPAFPEDDTQTLPRIAADWMIDFDLYESRKRRADELALADIGERGPALPAEKASAFEEARGKRARQLEEQNWRPRGALPLDEMIAHAVAAAAEFQRSMQLDPKNGFYPLGLASLEEQVAGWASEQHTVKLPMELRAMNAERAREAYLQAFRLAVGPETAVNALPVSGLTSLVTFEAGHSYLRLSQRESAKSRSASKTEAGEVRAGLKKVKRLPLGAITPLIFSMRKGANIDALLAPEKEVDFDLRGFGPREKWPWVKPETALVVWDPRHTGAITSARQLFGNYTFEIFRRDGFEALAALDENGDGQLTGAELHGLRVWFDKNGDGRSEASEVHDLSELGITAFLVNAPSWDGIHPLHPVGVVLGNGATLPLWDWIAAPAK